MIVLTMIMCSFTIKPSVQLLEAYRKCLGEKKNRKTCIEGMIQDLTEKGSNIWGFFLEFYA